MLFKKLGQLLNRTNRRRKSSGAPVSAEMLEARSLPTGTVSAVVSGGSLFLYGDAEHNSVTVNVGAGGIDLVGNGTSIKFNGTTTAAGTPVHLTNSLSLGGSVFSYLYGGNDSLLLNVTASLNVGGGLFSYLGSGNDTVSATIAPGVTLDVKGSIYTDLGSGNNTVTIINSGTLNVGLDFYTLGGSGDDVIRVSDLAPTTITVKGATTFLGGLGNDYLSIGGSSVTLNGPVYLDLSDGSDEFLAFGNVQMKSTFTALLGGNNDALTMEDKVSIAGAVYIDASTGDDVIGLIGDQTAIPAADPTAPPPAPGPQNFKAGGNVTIYGLRGDDLIGVTGADIKGGLFVYGGSGGDCLGAYNVTVGGPLFVYGESGDDTIAAGLLNVSGLAYVDAGVGNDTVAIDRSSFGGPVTLQLLSGDDKLILGEIEAAKPRLVNIYGGAGTDKTNLSNAQIDAFKALGVHFFEFEPGQLTEAQVTAALAHCIAEFQGKFGGPLPG